MASVKLSEKALGSVVTLKENGTAAEFVVACHNYEAGLNGAGRTLLVRKTSLEDKQKWGSVDSTTDLNWGKAYLKSWLEGTYAARLDEEIRRNIGKTKYHYDNHAHGGTEQAEGSVFLLSAYELSGEKYYEDGSIKLDDTVLRALESGGGSPWWTRSVWPNSQKEDGDDMQNWWYTRVCLYRNQYSNKWSVYESGFPDAEYGSTATIRPCFTVPGTMRVDGSTDGGSVRENHPPKIGSDFPDAGMMGSYSKGFSFTYAVYDDDADTMKVTEYVNGIQLQQFNAQNGQQETFTLDEKVFGQLAAEKYHTVKITADDGYKSTEWTQTFYKSYQVGYRVYAGTLKKGSLIDLGGWIGLGSDSLPYKWATRECIYDPTCVDDELDNIIIDPQLEMEKNELGSFEFTLPVSSRFYNSLIPRRTVVSVEEDGVEIWMGYVAEIDKNFQMEKKVYCEGELGFLKDVSLVLEPKEYTAYELFSTIIAPANAKSWKSFKTGKISDKLKDIKVNLKDSGTQYTTVWEALKNILLGNVGGMLHIRKTTSTITGGYARYLDYFWTEDELGLTTQCIEFGKNLLDLDYYVKAYDIVNRVTYYGYETKGWWIFAHTDKISVTVEDAKSVEIYGPIERCYAADGTASTKESLTKAANEKLNELKLKMDCSFEISALDLRDAGVDVMRLGFMKRAQILSWPHGLNQIALCTKLSIPLEKPDEKKFTFGSASETLSGQQATGTGAAKRAVETLRSVVSYINR